MGARRSVLSPPPYLQVTIYSSRFLLMAVMVLPLPHHPGDHLPNEIGPDLLNRGRDQSSDCPPQQATAEQLRQLRQLARR